jgi:hypothetical protein
MYNSRDLTYIAGEILVKGDKCYVDDDNKAMKVDLTDAKQTRFVGVAATNAALGEEVALTAGLQSATADAEILPGQPIRFSCASGTAGRVIGVTANNLSFAVVGKAMEKIANEETGKVFFY